MKTTLRIVLTTLLCFALSLLIPTNGVFAEGTASGVLSLPASTLIVDIEAFYGDTSINKVILPNGVKEIRARAFADSTLTEINLPDSLTLIDESAFSVPGNITVTANKGSWVYNWAKTKGFKMYDDPSPLADFVFQAIDDTGSRITGYQGNDGRVVIPTADADGRTVKEIGSDAFARCNSLVEVTLPSTLEKLGDSAFSNCKNLTTVNIPSGLQQVYYYSGPFTGCEALTNVEIEDGMVTIPSSLFAKSGIREIRIPDSVKNISREVFMQCTSLENVIFPEGLENIGTNCFYGCTSLKKVTLPGTVRNLGGVLGSSGWDTANGSGVFRDCTALAEVTLPQNLDFASSAFTGCSALKTVTMLFPSQLSFRALFGWSDDSYSFSSSNPNVASVYINSGVVSTYSIGSTVIRAVRDGTAEAELTVYVRNGYVDSGSSVASGILREGDEWAIRWMITYDEDTAGTPSNAQLYIYLEGSIASAGELALNSSLEDENLMPWLTNAYGFQKTDFNYIHIQGSATNPFKTIPGQFSGYSNVRRVELTCVRNIQAESFCDCSGLEQLVFDNWLLEIGNAAFKNDENLYDLRMSTSFGANIGTIGDEAFMNTGISSFSFNRVLHIGERAFANTQLGSIMLDSQINSIGEDAFYGCNNLVVNCYNNSIAHNYAAANNHRFRILVDKKYAKWGKQAGTIRPLEYAILNKLCTDVSYNTTTDAMEDEMYDLMKNAFPLGHPLHADDNPDLSAISKNQVQAFIRGTNRDLQVIEIKLDPKNVILIFAGTKEGQFGDIVQDVGIALDSTPGVKYISGAMNAVQDLFNQNQIEAGNQLANELSHFGYNTYLTGYSLGGHIAVDVALHCQELTECVAIDPPGRGDTIITGSSKNRDKITNYINRWSSISWVGQHVGTVYYLDVEENWLLGVIHNHDIEYTINALGGYGAL